MTTKNNPWEGMQRLSQRRVSVHTPHDLFWITDSQESYGLRIQTNSSIDFKIGKIKLKGIQLFKGDLESNHTDLFIILYDKKEWEIFLSLCDDLIKVILDYSDGKEMLGAIEIRLKRWQQLLKAVKLFSFPIEQQMGLFSELLCLKDIIISKYGVHQAILAWNGPESDKQDFLLDNAALEVKSYRTSKGDNVSISSLKQLYCEKNFLYMVTYALTTSENGKSIEELVEDIKKLIMTNGTDYTLELFEAKLLAYGYAPEIISEEVNQFIVDKQRIFSITDTFPKITPLDVRAPIVSACYSIDLSKCREFEVNLENFLK